MNTDNHRISFFKNTFLPFSLTFFQYGCADLLVWLIRRHNEFSSGQPNLRKTAFRANSEIIKRCRSGCAAALFQKSPGGKSRRVNCVRVIKSRSVFTLGSYRNELELSHSWAKAGWTPFIINLSNNVYGAVWICTKSRRINQISLTENASKYKHGLNAGFTDQMISRLFLI